MSIRFGLICVGGAVGLAACAEVPLKTQVALARFDPMQADLGGISVLVEVPNGIAVQGDGATLTLAATQPSGAEVSETVVLRPRAVSMDGGEDARLRWRFDLNPADVARLEQTRAEIRALKAADPDTAGALSVAAAPCQNGELPGDPEQLLMDVYLQDAAEGPALPVAPQVDLRDMLEGAGAGLPPC